MLSSARALEFEPRRPLHDPARTNSQPNTSAMHAAQASTSRLPTSPSKQPSSIPSCISPSSVFYQVLTAPYRRPMPATTYHRSPVDPQHAEVCHRSVDWTRRSLSGETHVDCDSAGTNAAASAILDRQIYTPHGRWAWADGLSVDDTEELMQLDCGIMCSATIKRGTLGTRQITYISRCWKTSEQDRWYGFYSELALYKAEHYLKPLQGDVLPWIIGVHVLPGAISIAMEPPHHSFWIEASIDMPAALKKRCIEAFEKIHERGVLHGDVELRHMLIGGDGKVTIIDFQMSRALVPNPDVMLLPAEPRELELEMRKVKYKLDYDGARKRETEKMIRSEERNQRIRARETDGDTEAHRDDILEEDIIHPPVHLQDWNESWANAAANATPTRFVMPGQTSEALAKEVRSFVAILSRMSTETSLPPARSERRQVRFASEVTSAEPVNTLPSEEFLEPFIDSSIHGMRKRKSSESSASGGSSYNTRLAKRARSDGELSTSTFTDEDEDVPILPGLRADPILVDYMANATVDKDRFTPPRTGPAEATDSVPINPSSHFPPIKVRDFVNEPYDGPRGYYAPYPLMESVVSLNRRRWIRLQKEQRCAELGLPLPRRSAKAATRTSNSSTSKQSKSDKHITRLVLGLSVVKRRTVVEGVPAPAQKRKRGDQETEMLESDFEEDDRRAKKVLTTTDRNARGPVPGPSTDPSNVLHPRERAQSQHRKPLESRAGQFVSADGAMEFGLSGSSKRSAASDRIAFATLGRLPPASRIKSNLNSHAHLSSSEASGASRIDRSMTPASQSRVGTPPRRKKGHRPGVPGLRHIRAVERCVSPSSEDEVEAMLHPSRMAVSPPPSSTPLGSWMGFLLHWLR